MFQLDNKVILITGAASGIGKGMAEHFAKNNAHVVIADINLEAASLIAEEIKNKNPNINTLAIKIDVSNEDEVNSGIDHIIKNFVRIDALVSNAGIQIISSIIEFKLSDWQQLMDIHMTGTFLITKACMKKMIELKIPGRIIVTGSIHSIMASENKSAYTAAKHAQLGFVRALAKEGAPFGITSNLICPGFVRTPLVENQIPILAKQFNISEDEVIKNIMLKDTLTKEFTTIEDIANTAQFLIGFKTTALSGQHILVSHGIGM